LRNLTDSSGDLLDQQFDHNPGASSRARSEERKELESAAIVRCLGQILRGWQERGDYVRLKVLELLWVKGWANRDVAAFLDISEQQVANYRFAAVKKLAEQIRDAGLSADVFSQG
jgi:RNA polymerase sigma-70 factor (ECF subfamily)